MKLDLKFGGQPVLLFTLISPLTVSCGVHWTIMTDPIVFGEGLTIYCNTSTERNNCHHCTRRWYRDDKLLTFDGYSVDNSKYASVDDQSGFTLEIKNTTENDFGTKYTCSYGFFTDTKLMTAKDNYEVHPTNETMHVSYSYNNSVLEVDVEMKKVYPAPDCRAFLNDKDLTPALISKQRKIGLFFKIDIHLSYNSSSQYCNADLEMNCSVVQYRMAIIQTKLNPECTSFESDSTSDLTTTCTSTLRAYKESIKSERHVINPFIFLSIAIVINIIAIFALLLFRCKRVTDRISYNVLYNSNS